MKISLIDIDYISGAKSSFRFLSAQDNYCAVRFRVLLSFVFLLAFFFSLLLPVLLFFRSSFLSVLLCSAGLRPRQN